MILTLKNKSLRQVCDPIELNDPLLPKIIQTLREELVAIKGKGIGLSANQIGVLKRVSLIMFPEDWFDKVDTSTTVENNTDTGTGTSFNRPRYSANSRREYVLINPRIISYGKKITVNEGCLSVPGIFADIEREDSCVVVNQTIDGGEETIRASGILAQALQHEIDHLDAKIFIDYFTKAQKLIYENRIRRIK